MKNYRVWEANRKIWLYPENWIEPELRDDKTPFFKDLENELLQSDLDHAAAEHALTHYLEKLDQVARLEIAGTYRRRRTRHLHVFGRTFTRRTSISIAPRGATQPGRRGRRSISTSRAIISFPWSGTGKLMLIWPFFTREAGSSRR